MKNWFCSRWTIKI